MNALNQAETEELLRGFSNHERFCNCLSIRNKDGICVPYRNSYAGQKLNKAIRKQEQAGVPVRIVCLKASQVWMSSSAATEIFRRVPFWPGRRALVVADSDTHAKLVFEYYTQYIKSYSDNPFGSDWKAAIELPPLVKDTDNWLRWANDSSILVGTAGNVDIGRSAPYNWAHLSEAAFYRALSPLMTGLMQRIPNSADSGVIVESTANGMGGDFYDLCQLAQTGRTGWLFVFFGYFEHPENSMEPTLLGYSDAGAFQKSLSRTEWEEQQRYNLTLKQLAWRRFIIETACEGKLERFQQEHPGNPQEAFVGSGRTIFDQGALSRMPVVQEPSKGKLEVYEVGLEKKIQFIQSTGYGELRVYQPPMRGKHYIIGVDHAEGIDPGAKDGKSDPDYCAATVLDADTGEQVAQLHERYEPRPWAERVFWLGKWYNFAFLTPERKAVGKAVIGHLLEISGGYPLELIYSAERDPSDRRPALLQDLGYETTVVSRSYLVSALDTAIREMAIRIHDPGLLDECRSFVRKANGREEGIKHDDLVISCALAVVGISKARRAFAYRDEQAQATQWKPVRYGRKTDDDDD